MIQVNWSRPVLRYKSAVAAPGSGMVALAERVRAPTGAANHTRRRYPETAFIETPTVRFTESGPMFHICEMVLDANGRLLSREELPYVFLDADTAGKFLDCFVEETFATGKSGYQREEECWWGCNDTTEIKLYRYTVEVQAGQRDSEPPGSQRD
jgi:hypothetical protein